MVKKGGREGANAYNFKLSNVLTYITERGNTSVEHHRTSPIIKVRNVGGKNDTDLYWTLSLGVFPSEVTWSLHVVE